MKNKYTFPCKILMIFGLFLVTFTGMAQDVGDEAPDFSLTTLNGNSFTLSNYRGKVVFIFFFGYACPHCLANGNNTETGIYNIYKSYEEFEAVGVDTWNGNNSGVSSFASTTGITYTLCLQAGALEATYQTTYDRIVVVDKEGIIRYKSTANSVTSIVSDAAQVVDDILNDRVDTTGSDTTGNMSTGIPPRNDRSQLKIYPVPASDQLIVDGLSSGRQNTRIAIFNSVGIMVLNNNASAFAAEEGRLDIPVSALPSGIYYVRLTSDQEVITRKIEIIGNR